MDSHASIGHVCHLPRCQSRTNPSQERAPSGRPLGGEVSLTYNQSDSPVGVSQAYGETSFAGRKRLLQFWRLVSTAGGLGRCGSDTQSQSHAAPNVLVVTDLGLSLLRNRRIGLWFFKLGPPCPRAVCSFQKRAGGTVLST